MLSFNSVGLNCNHPLFCRTDLRGPSTPKRYGPCGQCRLKQVIAYVQPTEVTSQRLLDQNHTGQHIWGIPHTPFVAVHRYHTKFVVEPLIKSLFCPIKISPNEFLSGLPLPLKTHFLGVWGGLAGHEALKPQELAGKPSHGQLWHMRKAHAHHLRVKAHAPTDGNTSHATETGCLSMATVMLHLLHLRGRPPTYPFPFVQAPLNCRGCDFLAPKDRKYFTATFVSQSR